MGVIATALFTGMTAVIAWLGYSHMRAAAGRRKPLVVRSAALAARRLPDDRAGALITTNERETTWTAQVFVFNHSDVSQHVVVIPSQSRVIWPRHQRSAKIERREIDLAPHDGGNLNVAVTLADRRWMDESLSGHRYCLWLTLSTGSGQTTRRPILVRPRLYEWREPPGIAG